LEGDVVVAPDCGTTLFHWGNVSWVKFGIGIEVLICSSTTTGALGQYYKDKTRKYAILFCIFCVFNLEIDRGIGDHAAWDDRSNPIGRRSYSCGTTLFHNIA
jgi:hypothetical protein